LQKLATGICLGCAEWAFGGTKDHAESVNELERDLDGFVQLVIGQTLH
jgi:hypothetical protein